MSHYVPCLLWNSGCVHLIIVENCSLQMVGTILCRLGILKPSYKVLGCQCRPLKPTNRLINRQDGTTTSLYTPYQSLTSNSNSHQIHKVRHCRLLNIVQSVVYYSLLHCTHHRWWLVLDWVATKEDHLLLWFDASKPLKYGALTNTLELDIDDNSSLVLWCISNTFVL